MNLLAIEPFFHPLHADRKFARLLKKLNLPALTGAVSSAVTLT